MAITTWIASIFALQSGSLSDHVLLFAARYPTNPTKMGPQPALPQKNSNSFQRAVHDRNGVISMAIVALVRTSIGLASHIDLSERTWALSTLFCLIGILAHYLVSSPQQVNHKSAAICLILFPIFARPRLLITFPWFSNILASTPSFKSQQHAPISSLLKCLVICCKVPRTQPCKCTQFRNWPRHNKNNMQPTNPNAVAVT